MDDMDSISIPRDYFDTLVRRAELHRDDVNFVTITKTEHVKLLRASQEYSALRTALIAGGLSPNNLEILINTPVGPGSKQDENLSPLKPTKWSADAPVFVPKTNGRCSLSKTKKLKNYCNGTPSVQTVPPTPTTLSIEPDFEDQDQGEEVEECYEEETQFTNNHDDRSVVLRGLSPFTTLADIAKVIRGGIVLNMFLRAKQRSAHVSFVDPLAAEKFIIHSKRSDIYIKGKRIEVYWDERQYYMSGHIARRINSGATRNIVVRFVKPDISSESIRQDLEHIDRLEVVGITHNDGHAFISLNGVTAAVTAKTCMASRKKYKGARIEFYPDECDQPLPSISKKQPKRPQPTKAATVSRMNRFALMLDEGEEEFENAHLGAVRRNVSAGEVGL